jgi:hypothetical protein
MHFQFGDVCFNAPPPPPGAVAAPPPPLPYPHFPWQARAPPARAPRDAASTRPLQPGVMRGAEDCARRPHLGPVRNPALPRIS